MKKILIIVTGILLLLSIPITVFYFGQQQELRKKAAPATTLSISPENTSSEPGETISFSITINTATNQVATAQINLLFDQTKAEALSITSGPQAPRILTQGITGPGTASITVGAESSVKPITGEGIIAIVRLKILEGASGPFTLQFGTNTFVGGLGETNTNVLVGKTGAQITLPVIPGATNLSSSTSTSPTPTPSIGTTPTPTPASSSGTLTVGVTENASNSAKPIIKGKAPAGSTVTIVVHSEPQTIVVTADAQGNYQVTPPKGLESGNHTIVVTAVDSTGQTHTTSSTFTVSAGNMLYTETTDATESMELDAMPESGSFGVTLVLLSISSIFLLFGGLSFAFRNQ